MRISDWSSDVCSSDLRTFLQLVLPVRVVALGRASAGAAPACSSSHRFAAAGPSRSILRRYSALFLEKAACRSACETCRDGVVRGGALDRKSGVEGKSVSGRVDLGGGRIIKKKKKN